MISDRRAAIAFGQIGSELTIAITERLLDPRPATFRR